MRYRTRRNLLAAIGGAVLLSTAASAQDFFQEFPEGAVEFNAEFITAAEVKRLMDEGDTNFLLVDNAPALAYDDEHIPGAVSYPWVHDLALPVTLPRNKTLILYCPCGPGDADSVDMAKKLRQFGYFRVKVLEGGWFRWVDEAYPIYTKAGGQTDA
jgi:rhodanese-related sulfurtransferase